MDGASAVTAFSSVIASTVKIAEKTFEIRAVDSQAKAVLATVTQCSTQLENARILRRQKSFDFSTFEKQMIDNTFQHAEEGIKEVANLAERARADISASGKVKVNTRLLYVLRDGPNIPVALTKLGIANSNLNMALFMLTSREPRRTSQPIEQSTHLKEPELKPSPTYADSNFRSEARQKNINRRRSAMSLRDASQSSCMPPPYTPRAPEDAPHRRQEPFADIKLKQVPSISVSEIVTEKGQDIDFNLFQQATGFHPHAHSHQTYPPARPIFHPEIKMPDGPEQADFIEYAGFGALSPQPLSPQVSILAPRTEEPDFACLDLFNQQRPRSWSGAAGLQEDELCFNTYRAYSPSQDSNISPILMRQDSSKKASIERWLEMPDYEW